MCNKLFINSSVYDTGSQEVAKVTFFAGSFGNDFHPQLRIAGTRGLYAISQTNFVN